MERTVWDRAKGLLRRLFFDLHRRLALARLWWLRRVILPRLSRRAEMRLRATWQSRLRVQPEDAEVTRAASPVVAAHRDAMERAFWANPKGGMPRIDLPNSRYLAEARLVADIKAEWQDADAARIWWARARAGLGRLARDRAWRAAPPLGASPSVEEALRRARLRARAAARQIFAQDIRPTELTALSTAHETRLRANAKAAITDHLRAQEKGFADYIEPRVRRRYQPQVILPLFLEGRGSTVAYDTLDPEYVNGDLHFEDQMIYGVDLVITPRGQVVFDIEPFNGGGLLRALRFWQRWG